MKDESTYGFNKADANALLEHIGMKEELVSSGRSSRGRLGRTGAFVEEIRWADPVLEYRIGTTWYNINTAENCATTSPFVGGAGV